MTGPLSALLFAAAASPTGAATAAEPAAGTARFVVAVGYNRSDNPRREDLRFADDDAARFFELSSMGARSAWLLTTFDERSQELYPSLVPVARAPTRSELARALSDLAVEVRAAKDAGLSTELHFFYAGHGDVDDGVGYVTLVDGRWSRRELESQLLRAVEVDVGHVIIDACKSYFMVSGRGPGGERTTAPSAYAGPELHPGFGFVLSTSTDAESHEFAEIDAGVFSHEVRSALVGGADVDGDGAVDYAELGAFVTAANEGIAVPKYRPHVFIRPPTGRREAPFFLPEGRGWLRLDRDVAGRVRVTDPRGLRHADLHKAAGAPIRVALLEPGTHEVELGPERFEVPWPRDEIELAALEPAPDAPTARGLEHEAFADLFSTALSLDVVRGFRLGQATEGLQAVAPPPRDDTRRDWGIALGAGGGAALIAGAVLAGLAADARTSAGAPELNQTERSARLDEADVLTASAVTVLAAGGAALATGIVLLLTD